MTDQSLQPAQPAGTSHGRLCLALGVGIPLVTLYALRPAIPSDFINWDDPDYFLNNPHIRSLSADSLGWCFTTRYMGHYQPLNWLSYAVDYQLWGLDAARFHESQLFLHAIAAVCVFAVALRLYRLTAPRGGREPVYFGAATAALFFCLHPLRAESVAWLSARADVLAAIFSLLAVWTYLRHAERQRAGVGAGRFPASALLFYLLAVLSKEMAVTLPLILIVLDVYPLGRIPATPRRWGEAPGRSAWREKIPFFLVAAVVSVVALLAAGADAVATLQEHPVSTRLAQVAVSLGFYVHKTIVPTGLSPLYEFPVGFGIWHGLAVVSGVGVALGIAALWLIRRRAPGVVAAVICHVILILPVSGLVQRGPQMVADRYSYLACLPLALLMGALAARLAARWGPTMMLLTLIGLAGLAVEAQAQLRRWADSETLWRFALSQDPTSGGAHAHLAHALEGQGRSEEAIEHYRKGLSLGWRHSNVHRNVAAILARQGRYEEAIPEYLADIAEYPGRWESCFYLAVAYERAGDDTRALEQYRAALALKPDMAEGHVALGRLFMEHGYFKEAEPRLRYALSLEPAHLEAMERLAILRERAGDRAEAAALLARCIAEAERRGETALAESLRKRRGALAPDAAP